MSRIFAENNVACQHCAWWNPGDEDDDGYWGECGNTDANDYSKAMIVSGNGVLLTEATHFCGDFSPSPEVSA